VFFDSESTAEPALGDQQAGGAGLRHTANQQQGRQRQQGRSGSVPACGSSDGFRFGTNRFHERPP